MNKTKLKLINIAFYSKWDSYNEWKIILLKYNLKLVNFTNDFNKNKTYPNIIGALVWDPPDELWQYFPNIKIIQSLGAGVDHILKKKLSQKCKHY